MPFLEKHDFLRVVDAEQSISQAFTEMCSHVEPTILHVRVGGSEHARDNAKMICEGLMKDANYFELEVSSLVRDEIERRTEIGLEIH
jgi:hypothetical protein